MDLNRRRFVLTAALGFAALSSGCVTPSLYEDKQYIEKVSAVLISSDAQKIAILSQNFHYIFDAPAELVRLLNSSLHKNTRASFGNFHEDGNHKITGSLSLFLDKELSDDHKTEALSIGFTAQYSNELRLKIDLKGTRYSAGKLPSYLDRYKLNKEHSVVIIAEQSNLSKALKVPLTPITVAIDGALILGTIVLSPLLLVVVANNVCFTCK